VYSLWGILAAAALLWPDRISGPFDGVPLDRVAEAVLIAGVLPALWYFHPGFLRSSRARACILALVAWRIASALLFVQDGWCVRFQPARLFAKDAGTATHAWDMRADWRAFEPACSAIMTRPYRDLFEFPAWFFNLPPPSDSWPIPVDRPPYATVAMSVHGFVSPSSAGVLQIDTGPDVSATISVDGIVQRGPSPIGPGVHAVAIDAVLTGDRWALVPLWNGQDLWSHTTATARRPSSLDLRARPWVRWIPLTATILLFALWLWSAAAETGTLAVLAWTVGASTVVGVLV
jgi:hypothetical protein